ncbi:SAX-1 protein [Aphelenchoides avenae]|nr:SAX-1 protein [Aphelenchus avenae]
MGHQSGIEEFKQCPFFKKIQWDSIRDQPAPIRIEVRGIADTSNFDDFGDCDLSLPEVKEESVQDGFAPQDRGEFLHYTFQRFQCLTQMMRYGSHPQTTAEQAVLPPTPAEKAELAASAQSTAI